jgi:hypothetical protein
MVHVQKIIAWYKVYGEVTGITSFILKSNDWKIINRITDILKVVRSFLDLQAELMVQSLDFMPKVLKIWNICQLWKNQK